MSKIELLWLIVNARYCPLILLRFICFAPEDRDCFVIIATRPKEGMVVLLLDKDSACRSKQFTRSTLFVSMTTILV